MINYTYSPQPPLSKFIELMWLYDDYQVPYAQEQVLPTGTTTLVINFALREVTLCGAHAQPFLLETKRIVSHLGVHFYPGGLAPFFDFPIQALQNEVVTLDLLWGSETFALRDQVLAAPSPLAQFQIVEAALRRRLQRISALPPAITFAVQQFQYPVAPTVANVADQLGMSSRWFRQQFQAAVGLSPKLFLRVQRFQQVLAQIEPLQTVDWADVAATYGFTDQAHLIHDFQCFSGISPTAYLARCGRHRNHVPLQE